MAKRFVVAHGQIEKGKQVLAREGDDYTPKTTAERERLLAAGVIAEPKKGKAAAVDDDDTGDTGGAAGNTGGTDGTGAGEAGGA